MKRFPLLAVCFVALLLTIGLICVAVIAAVQVSSASSVRTTALTAAVLEAIVGLMLVWFALTLVSNSLSSVFKRSSSTHLVISLVLVLLACLLAAAVSVACIVCLKHAPNDAAAEKATLVALSVFLAVAATCQLVFLVGHYLDRRRTASDGTESIFTEDSSRPSPKFHVKSIPYSRTRPSLAENRGKYSMESMDTSRPDSRRQHPHVVNSPRSSMSASIRQATSKTQLLSVKEKQRFPPLDPSVCRDSIDVVDDAWDARSGSSKHTAQELPSPTFPKARPLETIPASPIIPSRPSLDFPSDLEPPAAVRQRGRSFSPARGRPGQRTLSPAVSSEELDIHPLFRSDSPTPPPKVTPGTSVMASPDAGKVIHHRPSNQSMRRVRSSSAASSSIPLSRQSSLDAPSLKRPRDEQDSILEVDEDHDEAETDLVPPIPDFVLSAGNRSSLTRYNSNKMSPGQNTSGS